MAEATQSNQSHFILGNTSQKNGALDSCFHRNVWASFDILHRDTRRYSDIDAEIALEFSILVDEAFPI